MKWPPSVKTQETFRDKAREGYMYPNLTTLVPKFKPEMICVHSKNFDSRDPIKMLWVLSRKIKIYNTAWVQNVDRVMYFRPTDENQCECKQV